MSAMGVEQVMQKFGNLKPGDEIKLNILGFDVNQKPLTKILDITIPEDIDPALAGDGAAMLDRIMGIQADMIDDILEVFVTFGGPAEEAGIQNGWRIVSLDIPLDRLPKQIMFIPALLLAALVFMSQRSRARRAEAA